MALTPRLRGYPHSVAGVAQLAEAAGLGPACWGFESLHRHSAYLRSTHTSGRY